MGWCDCLRNAAPVVARYRGDALTAAINALAGALAAAPMIRLYVDRGGGTGQQAAAVNLLRRIISQAVPVGGEPPGLGFTGAGKSCEIIYDAALDTTLPNLQRLLNLGGAVQGNFLGLHVELFAESAVRAPAPPRAHVRFSFSGATDDNADVPFETMCFSAVHLRLQPFMYGKPELLLMIGHDPINLTRQDEVGGESFAQLGFYLPTPPLDAAAWALYLAGANRVLTRRIGVLRFLIDRQFAPGGAKLYELMFTYGIHTLTWRNGSVGHANAIGARPTEQVVQLTLGVMATQVNRQGAAVPGALPAVIVNLDDFWYDDTYFTAGERAAGAVSIFRKVNDLLGGGRVDMEPEPNVVVPAPTPARQAGLQALAARRGYLTAVHLGGGANVASRFTPLNDPTVAEVTNAMQAMLVAPNPTRRVMWVQLVPEFPPNLFNSLLGAGSLPAVFEGNNTANQALAFPAMYFNTNRPGFGNIRYPSLVLAARPGNAPLQTLQRSANQVGVPLASWPNGNGSDAPPELFAGPIRAWRNENEATGTYHRYFTNVSDFFRQVENDKYSLGFAFLGQKIQDGNVPMLLAQPAVLLAADTGLLAALYATLTANLNGNSLTLLPGGLKPAGKIASLLSDVFGLAGTTWTLAGATIVTSGGTPPSDKSDSITVTGNFSLSDLSLRMKAVFTVASAKLTAHVEVTGIAPPPPLPGLQWAPFQSCAIVFDIADGNTIPVVEVRAALQWPGSSDAFDVTWPLTVTDGALKLTGNFNPPLSIDYAFKLAGGVNLLSQVPPPFSALTGLGVTGLEMGYDTTTSSASFVSVLVSYTGAPVPLFSVLSIDSLSMILSVANPGDPATRNSQAAIQSQFALGQGTIQIAAELPGMVFRGELTEGEIALSDLIKFFTLGVVITPDTAAAIDNLRFDYDTQAGTGSLTVDLNAGWSICPAGIPALVIESLGLAVQIDKSQSADSQYSGTLTGGFTLLSGTPTEVGLQVTAAWDSAAGWQFNAKQTSGTLKLLAFITTYLGGQFTFSDDLTLSGIELSLAPGVKGAVAPSYGFKMQTAAQLSVDFLGLSIQKVTAEINYLGSVVPAAVAAMASPREAPPLICGLPLSAAARAGYRRRAALRRARIGTAAMDITDVGGGQQGLSGSIGGQVKWFGITLDVTYDFQKPSGGQTDQKISLDIILDDQPFASAAVERKGGKTKATFEFGQDTLGGVVETFVSWATGQRFSLGAPWDLLDSIPLNRFQVIFDFDSKKVDFSWGIGPITIGPAVIRSIDLNYQTATQSSPSKVWVTLTGTFPWQPGNNTLKWDAADPASTQAPPGGGNKYFDLRMLALGQHLAMTSSGRIDHVAPLIAALSSLVPPDGKGVPVPLVSDQIKLDYSAGGGWLVAADFGILKTGDDDPDAGDGYVVQFSAVFNDPVLYAARIALAGKAAKIFAGLEFEIIYQQVSATAGVWRARIALPTSLRTFEAGAVTITLPEFGIGIYTNGDFEVDVGYPWNMDFGVSFSVAAIIAGIPVLGSGGFYFAKLSEATKSQVPPGTSVPAAINGTFNPIIAFGFGAQFGLGKSLSMGVLKAGFSLTAFGIVQGVIAKWHPYDGSGSGPGGSTELQGQYYFQLSGTFGLIGKLYGSLDFVIVSASLDIDIHLYVQIGYTSYQPIVISAVASVDVQLTVSVNLGLFSIHIHFGFSATVKATFELQVGSNTAPWQIAPPAGPTSLLHAPPQMRLFAGSHGLFANAPNPLWEGKLADTAPSARVGLTGQFVPTLTATGDAAKVTGDQKACYVAMLLLDAPGPVTSGTPQPDSDGSAFEKLCRLVGAWIGASVQADDGVPLATLWTRPVTEAQLKTVVDSLSGDNPFPIPLDAIEGFLAGQVAMAITVPPSTAPPTVPKGMVFPPPPDLRLQAPGVDYSFGGLTTTDPSYLSDLKALFNRLAVQVEHEQQDGTPRVEAPAAAGPSVAAFVYAAWFALLARQLTNAMLQGLRNFQYDPKANVGGTLAALLTDLNGQLGTPDAVDAATLLVANPRHPINGGKQLQVTGAPLTAGASETIAAIAARAFSPPSGAYFDAQSLAALNPEAPLAEGATFTLNGAPQSTVASDTLAKLAQRLTSGVVSTLLSSSNVAAQVPLVTGAALTAPTFVYTTNVDDVFEDLARRFGVGVESFAVEANLNVVSGLFLFDDVANRFLAAPHLTTASVQALVDEAQRSGAFRHASGMLSRFMLHGLRLQAAGKVTPTAPALFVAGEPGSYAYTVDEAGIYVLTGQQFALPSPFLPSYQVTLSQAARTWLTLGSTDGLSAVFKVADYGGTQPEQARVANLQSWLARNILDVGVTAIGPEAAITFAPASYSVTSAAPWLNLGRVTLPSGGDVAANAGLTLLQLPGELSALAAQTVTVTSADGSRKVVSPDAPPAFELTLQRYDQATGKTVPQPAGAFGWASLVTLNIRRDTGSNAVADTYELIGAGEADILVLERLIEAIGDSDAMLAGLAVLYPSGAKATPSLVSDDFTNVRTGLIQSNLTTVTLPPSGVRGALEGLAQAPAPWTQVYNPTIAQFLRFVWEASITRSGGFYLYYYDMARKAGLPDSMFNDQGEGKVNLLVVHRNHAAVPAYVNCTVLGQGIIGKDLAVTAMASQPPASIALTDTLDAIGMRAYLPASSIAEQLASQVLIDGKALSVAGGLYQVTAAAAGPTQPGSDPGAIAKWFGTSLAALQAANAGAPASWWIGGVPLLAALRLPPVSVATNAAAGRNSLAAIAAYWRTTVAQLGADNRAVPGLFAGIAATVTAGPVAISPIEPPGVVGYLAQRLVPADPTDAQSLMASLFTMLGYAVAANQDFVRVPALPAGPRTGGSVGKGKLRTAVAADDGIWRYRLTVPTYRCAPGWTPGNDNPYSALGKVLQLDLRWQDLFGNRLLGPAASAPIGSGCYNLAPATAGYTDRLIGIGGWPSITTTWAVAKAGVVTLSLSFNMARYQAGNPPPSPLPDYRTNAARDLAVYQRIARQLADPNGVAWRLQTSLDASGTVAMPAAMTAAVKALLLTIQAYLEAIAAGQAPANIPAVLSSFDLTIGTHSQAQVSSISMAFVLARNAALVAGAAHDTPGVASAVTALAPAIDANADCTSGMATSIAAFATTFEAAMSDSGAAVKLAVGPDRYAGRGPQQMWAVRIARSPAAGIGFELAPWIAGQPLAPMIYARRPMSRVLASRQAVPVWLYDGKNILVPGSSAYTNQDFSQIDTETWGQAFAQAFDRMLTPPYASPALVVDARAKTKYLQRLRDAKTKVAGALSKLVIPVFEQVPVRLPVQAQPSAQEAMRQTLLEQLSNAFAADVVVQFPVAVQASIDEPAPPNAKPVPPRLFGGVGFVNDDPTATLTATSTKIDLATTSAAAPELLTFMVTTGFPAGATPPAYVPVGAGQGAFAGSNVEHQIGSLTDIVGYEASSWLSFPVPLQADPKNPLAVAVFPAFDVPVIVRAYPPTPHLDKQLGEHQQGDQPDLRQARAWSYEALFSRDSHPPQDRLKITIRFNHPASPSAHRLSTLGAASLPPPPPDSFSALAEFTAAYPKISAALDANLRPINPDAVEAAIDQASLALGSFVALAEHVAQGFANEFGTSAIGQAEIGAGPEYAFELFEGDVLVDVYVLVIDARPPADIGTPSIELPGFDTLLCTGLQEWTPPLYKSQIQTGTAFAYGFKAMGSSRSAAPLTREDGRQVRGRIIVLPGLDVLARQDALMAVSVFRNPDLVPSKSTADAFVYATPPVAFTAPLRPTVTDSRVLRIDQLGGGVKVTTLRAQLQALWDGLFAGAPSSNTIQCSVHYVYGLGPARLQAVSLPVLMLPKVAFTLPPSHPAPGEFAAAELLDSLTGAVQAWFGSNNPAAGSALVFDAESQLWLSTPGAGSGLLVFDLVVMAAASGMPLLQLSNLTLPISSASPPLPTS